jgi:sulfide:quinone oxidoreductase
MAHVVIIGASTGGLPAAYDIKDKLGKNHEVTVINISELFSFVPSNPWVAVGWRSRKDVTFELEPYLKKKGINFIAQTVTELKPDDNQVVLADGRSIDYDYLVIATGPKLAFDEVEGLGRTTHPIGLHHRSRGKCLSGVAEVRRAARPHRGRCRPGRLLLRPRL